MYSAGRMNSDGDDLSNAPLLLPQSENNRLSGGVTMAEEGTIPTESGDVAMEEQPRDAVENTTGASKPKGKPKPITLCIYTLKEGTFESIKFESGRLTNAQDIMSAMMHRLGLPQDSDQVFSLWLTSKHLQLQLKSYHLPCKLFKRWKDLLSQYTNCTFEEVCEDEPILSFQRSAFYHLRDERKLLKYQDSTQSNNYRLAIDLLFHESVFNTLRGRYPLSESEFHTLAGLLAAIQYTESGRADVDRQELLSSINSFYPPHMQQSRGSLKKISKLFKQKTVDNKQYQEEFLRQHKDALDKCQDPHQLKCRYLQMCWHKPYYGSVQFRGVVEKSSLLPNNEQVILAVNTDCIHLMTSALPSEILLYLTYDQLSWEFKPAEEEGEEFYSSLLLEFDSVLSDQRKVAKRVQIFSRQAPMMDAMISRCVDSVNAKEEELRQLRLQQGNSEFVDYFFTTTKGDSGKVQKQQPNYKEHKLKCTVVDPDSSTSGFTLSRLKKKKISTTSKEEVATYNVPSDTLATPLGVTEGASSSPQEVPTEITGEVCVNLVVGGESDEEGQEETPSNLAVLSAEV